MNWDEYIDYKFSSHVDKINGALHKLNYYPYKDKDRIKSVHNMLSLMKMAIYGLPVVSNKVFEQQQLILEHPEIHHMQHTS